MNLMLFLSSVAALRLARLCKATLAERLQDRGFILLTTSQAKPSLPTKSTRVCSCSVVLKGGTRKWACYVDGPPKEDVTV